MPRFPRVLSAIVCSTAFLLLVVSCLAEPTWFRGGPGGGEVLSLAASPRQAGVLYAGAHPGIFKTTDSGEHWFLASPAVARFQATQIVVARGTPEAPPASEASTPDIILATDGSSVVRSADGGGAWSFLTVPSLGDIRDIDCDSSGRAFLAGSKGILRSEDAGAHWTLGLDDEMVDSVSVGTGPMVYAGGREFIATSTDHGVTWLKNTLGDAVRVVTDILVDPFNPSVIYMVYDGEVRKSSNAGETWGAPMQAVDAEVDNLVADFSSQNTVFAFEKYSQSAFSTNDAGDHWRHLTVSRKYLTGVASDTGIPGTLFLGFGVSGVLKSVDAGEHWVDASVGIPAFQAYQVAVDPNNGAVAYASVNGLHKTTDAGRTWTQLAVPTPCGMSCFEDTVVTHPNVSDRLYASSANNLYVSADGGASWTPREAAPPGIPVRLITVAESGVYIDREGTLRKSVDDGQSWVDCGVPNPGQVVEAPSDSRILYCVGGASGLYKSTDSGQTWNHTGGEIRLCSLAVDHEAPSLLLAVGPPAQGWTYSVLWRSLDGGATWERGGSSGERWRQLIGGLAFDPNLPNVAYAGFNEELRPFPTIIEQPSGDLWRTENAGISWNRIAPSWPFAEAVGEIAFSRHDPRFMYVGTADGVFCIETGFGAEQEVGVSRSHDGDLTAEEDGEYSILVTNVGRRSTSGTISVTETLPPGAELIEASGPFWKCGLENGSLHCTRFYPIPSGLASKITVKVKAGGAAAPAAMLMALVSAPGDWNPFNNVGRDLIPVNNVFYFPHIANGALGPLALDTSFFFLNTGAECDFEAEFLDQEAAPLNLPLDGLSGVSFGMRLGPAETVQVQTSGAGAPAAGYARVKGGPGITGTAVLRYSTDGEPVSEAAVLPVYPSKQSRLFLDRGAKTRTALAVTNRGDAPARFTVKVRNSSGELAAEKSSLDFLGLLESGAYRAFYLSEMFPEVELPALGMIEIDSDQALAIMSLRETGPTLSPAISLLPATMPPNFTPAQPIGRVFPYLVSGRWEGWTYRTRLLFHNAAAAQKGAHVTFHARDGAPMQVELEGLGAQSSHDITLQPGQTLALQTTGAEALLTGYVTITAPRDMAALTLLEIVPDDGGSALRQTVIPVGEELLDFSLLVDRREGFETGLALVNRSDKRNLVIITLRLGPQSFVGILMNLAPGEQVAEYVANLFASVWEQDPNLDQAVLEVSAILPVSALVLRQGPPGESGEPGLLALFPVFPGRLNLE